MLDVQYSDKLCELQHGPSEDQKEKKEKEIQKKQTDREKVATWANTGHLALQSAGFIRAQHIFGDLCTRRNCFVSCIIVLHGN